MGNQYSITVSKESNFVLEELKKSGYMPSRLIDAAIRTIRHDGLVNMYKLQQYRKRILDSDEE